MKPYTLKLTEESLKEIQARTSNTSDFIRTAINEKLNPTDGTHELKEQLLIYKKEKTSEKETRFSDARNNLINFLSNPAFSEQYVENELFEEVKAYNKTLI